MRVCARVRVRDVSPESVACCLALPEEVEASDVVRFRHIKAWELLFVFVWHGMWAHASEWRVIIDSFPKIENLA